MDLSNDELRLLVCALDHYVSYWQGVRSSRNRALQLIDTCSCAGKLQYESMSVDLSLSQSHIDRILVLRDRICQSIR